MSNVKLEVQAFISKCDEFKSCKFIMATTKIKDLLKCIVNSSELYLLFKEVTQNFDYVTCKKRCLISSTNGYVNKNYVVLPESAGDQLAFIFCLLVEFDRDSINFNSFLQRFYAEDGSYYASYHAFCDDIICTLKNIVKSVFEAELSQSNESELFPNTESNSSDESNAYLVSLLTQTEFLIRREIDNVNKSKLSNEEKSTGINILTELFNAIKQANIALIEALLQGYYYFSANTNTLCQSFEELVINTSRLTEALCS